MQKLLGVSSVHYASPLSLVCNSTAVCMRSIGNGVSKRVMEHALVVLGHHLRSENKYTILPILSNQFYY